MIKRGSANYSRDLPISTAPKPNGRAPVRMLLDRLSIPSSSSGYTSLGSPSSHTPSYRSWSGRRNIGHVTLLALILWATILGIWMGIGSQLPKTLSSATQAWLNQDRLGDLPDLLKHCGVNCKFIFPARVGEQETKAQMHLHQLGLLSAATNRILVLPYVKNGRMNVCTKQSPTLYYPETALTDLGVPSITPLQFSQYVATRGGILSGQMWHIDRGDITGSKLEGRLGPLKNCGQRNGLDFDNGREIVNLTAPVAYHKNEQTQFSLAQQIYDSFEASDADVLFVDYDLRYTILTAQTVTRLSSSMTAAPLAFKHFSYSETWKDLGNAIVDNITPFIAVHWRTETVPADILAPCASRLVVKLAELKEAFPHVKSVYLSSDYPFEALENNQDLSNIQAHSGTFTKLLTEEHHRAMAGFLEKFAEANIGVTLTSFAKEEKKLNLPAELKELVDQTPSKSISELDSAFGGFIDKIVGSRANLFISGAAGDPETACGRLSSFTRQIVGLREEIASEQNSLWNIADTFAREVPEVEIETEEGDEGDEDEE